MLGILMDTEAMCVPGFGSLFAKFVNFLFNVNCATIVVLVNATNNSNDRRPDKWEDMKYPKEFTGPNNTNA